MAGELILSIGGFGRRIYDVVHTRDMAELFVLIATIGIIGFAVDEFIFKNIEHNIQKKWGLGLRQGA